MRGIILLPALVIVADLAIVGPASAQTGFTASIATNLPKPDPCPGGAFFCGTAMTNYGPASWTLVPTQDAQTSYDCGIYAATTTFVLEDGSTLALDEAGTLCQPGNALTAHVSAPHGSYGNPFSFSANWTVQSAGGQFASVTGSGTDALSTAGARVTGTYSQPG